MLTDGEKMLAQMKSVFVPGRKVWSAFELEQVKGDVRHANRKHDSATVVSQLRNSKVSGKPSVSVVFDRVFYRTSGYQLPAHMATWMMRRANVPCELLLTQDPSPLATLEKDDELYLSVADARWGDPTLTAKQVHHKLVSAATGLPTLAAVKRCLTRLQTERRCPMVHARGASDILDLIVATIIAAPPDEQVDISDATCDAAPGRSGVGGKSERASQGGESEGVGDDGSDDESDDESDESEDEDSEGESDGEDSDGESDDADGAAGNGEKRGANGRGESEPSSLPLRSVLALSSTCKAVRIMLEEHRLQLSGPAIVRHDEHQIYKAAGLKGFV